MATSPREKSSIYTHSKYKYFEEGKPKTGNSLSLVTVCTGSAEGSVYPPPKGAGAGEVGVRRSRTKEF